MAAPSDFTRPPREQRVYPEEFHGELVKYSRTCGWVLCIGAGISKGIFPDWRELATSLLQQAGSRSTDEEIEVFLREFGPAAMMQAAINALEHNVGEELSATQNRLTAALFKPLRDASGRNWQVVADALTSARPASLEPDEWRKFLRVIGKFKHTSAPSLARALANVAATPLQPAGIVSFNAEPLLYALINAYAALRPVPLPDPEVTLLDRMAHDLASRHVDRIPYYYAHGLLNVPDGRERFNDSLSPGKIVFTESQYLNLSRSVYSWQAATFLSVCMHHRCVFAGLSFTDPNLRRWLAWEYEGRRSERERKELKHRPTHYWIKKRLPHRDRDTLTAAEILVEDSVRHLGLRVIWVDEWDEVGEVLRIMLDDTPSGARRGATRARTLDAGLRK
jgi:hypothetical protein